VWYDGVMGAHDVIIVGSGQAGVPLATRLAAAGRKVLLAERSKLGGTCVNYGCTPTKTMVASARAAHVARTCGRLGVRAGDVTVDLAAVVARKDAVVKRWVEGVEKRLAKAGDRLEVAHGHARFTGPHEVEVGMERHTAETIIVNVGARPMVPALAGLESVPWLDNRRVMELCELPAHLLVLGGGYIGCELAQMFRRFGSEVTILQHGHRLLSRAEPEAAEALEKALRAEGIHLELDVEARAVSTVKGQIVVRLGSGADVRGSHLLVAVGRKPNTDDLGCDKAGVMLDARGFVEVDDRYQTRVPGVHAVGDVTGGPQFTHTSWDDHRILFDLLEKRAHAGAPRTRADRVIPSTVFTDPEVASVGLIEADAKKLGLAYEVATMPFGNVARAIEVDETAGVMKVILDAKTERILGATLVGAEAGELIHVFVGVMQAGATARAIVDAEFAHPTFAEGVQSLVMRLKRYALS
jgi:pyruvate/2-oxoglutarate dehydrogenase complex dihydrolipoamide dehydrogenase (E3) component